MLQKRNNKKHAERDIDVHYTAIIVDLQRIDGLGMTVNADLSTNPIYRRNAYYCDYSDHLAIHLRKIQNMPQLIEEGKFKPEFNF